ncbi:MAG: hypothetical protein ACHQK8_09050, partial [Bacteroidia bacterium]
MTRPLFLFTTILLFVYAAQAQPYRSIFGKTSTSWTSTRDIPDATTTDSVFTTFDTVFGGHNYKKVIGKYFGVNGFIREDTASGKAWFYANIVTYPYTKDTECLIMNLSLSVGDSFGFNFTSYYGKLYFVKVDSVYFVTGRKYIRFKYDLLYGTAGEEGKFTFIEGIGSTAGILFQHYSWNPFLLCKFMDGQKEYSNNFFQGRCWVDLVGIEEKKSNQSLNIFPNPFNGSITISFNGNIYEKINI